MALLIKNGLVVTMNRHREVLQADVYIEGNRIAAIEPNSKRKAETIIDAGGKLVIPGLIQTHVHLCQAPVSRYGRRYGAVGPAYAAHLASGSQS